MADSNQAKRAETEQFNENDPFAELTRIMGHDPRADDTQAYSQDLSIDLEKELMGELDFDEFQEESDQPQAPAHDPVQDFASPEASEEPQGGFEGYSDLAGEAGDVAREAYGEPEEQSGWVESVYEDEDIVSAYEPAADAGLDLQSEAVTVPADDFEAMFEADLAQEFEDGAAQPAEDWAAPEAEYADEDVTPASLDFDQADAAGVLEQDAAAFGGDDAASYASSPESAETDAAEMADFSDQPEPAYAADADMAEVDMDFDVTRLDEEDFDDEALDAPAPNLSQAQKTWVGYEASPPADDEPFSSPDEKAVVSHHEPDAPADLSLEDELSALLADDGASDDAAEMEYEPVEYQSAEQPSDYPSYDDDVDAAGPAVAAAAVTAAAMTRPDPVSRPHPTIMSAPRQLAWAKRSDEPVSRSSDGADTVRESRAYGVATPVAAYAPQVPQEPSYPAAEPAMDENPSDNSHDWQESRYEHAVPEPEQPDFDRIFEDEGDDEPMQAGFEGVSASSATAPAYGSAIPDIETVEVMEPARSVDQEFDVPDLPPEEEIPQTHPELDDIEGDLASAFEDFDPGTEGSEEQAPSSADHDGGFAQWEQPVAAGAAATATADPQQDWQYQDHDAYYRDDYADEPHGEYEPDEGDYQEPAQRPLVAGGRNRRRGYLIAGLVAGVALIGGAGVFGMTMLGGGSDGPILIGADSDPTRVRPEDRGGTVVPNQESEAYQRVAGESADNDPRQEQLITTAEEPIDLSAGDLDMPPRLAPGISDGDEQMAAATEAEGFGLSAVKSEERIEAAGNQAALQEGNENVVLAPRRVRTMVVRPDGSIVPREEAPAEAAAAENGQAAAGEPAEAPASTAADSIDGLLSESVPPLEGEDASAGQAAAGSEGGATSEGAETQAATADTPALPGQASADEPQEVASAANAAAAVTSEATSEWSMQIASQPSAESAQATYQDLARRYGNLLEGRGVNIVSAEIDGRGTFYRVRIPASTRDEAVQLCTQYQAAGGSCFVSR